MKAAYFYINYQAKGVGYTILMIAPFAALFLTVSISAQTPEKCCYHLGFSLDNGLESTAFLVASLLI